MPDTSRDSKERMERYKAYNPFHCTIADVESQKGLAIADKLQSFLNERMRAKRCNQKSPWSSNDEEGFMDSGTTSHVLKNLREASTEYSKENTSPYNQRSEEKQATFSDLVLHF